MKRMITLLFIPVLLIAGCTKNFLDVKPDQSLVVPTTLDDLQALLDNTNIHNINMPSLQEASSDDYYVTAASYQSVTVPMYQNAYIWKSDIYAGSADVNDWNGRYQQIFYANNALEGLGKLKDAATDPRYAAIKGTALFFRAFAFFQLAQLYCKPYDPACAKNDPGIPLRTSSDINKVTGRGTVEETYTQIIGDLKTAISLLPVAVPFKTRPSLTAAQGLLARVYLSMNDYTNALQYADAALNGYSTLIDYNTLSQTATLPFSRFNNEVIFHSTMANTSITLASRLIVDTLLYRAYQVNDLRPKLYFKTSAGVNTFKATYAGSTTFFNGIATDELYLIRAECYARTGNTQQAMTDLNTLLTKRWKSGTFSALTAATAGDALKLILAERRKELIFRGLRWTDLRRLNLDPNYAITLRRNLSGQSYTLPPNDKRYVLPIPDLVIQLSGIFQNPR